MSSQKRISGGGAPTRTDKSGTDSATGTGTAPPSKSPAAYGNGAMQEYLATHRETLEKGRTRTDAMTGWSIDVAVDTSVLDGLDALVREVLPASTTAVGLAGEAVRAQQVNDVAAWQNQLWTIADGPGELLDQAAGQIGYQWGLIGDHFPDAAADPRYAALGAQIKGVEATGRLTTRLLATLLQPLRVWGVSLPELPGPTLPPDSSVGQALKLIEDRFVGLMNTAVAAEVQGEGAHETGGRALESRVLDLAVGPIGAYPVGSPEFEYVWASFEHSPASPEVRARLALMLGIVPSGDAFPIFEAMATNALWAAGDTTPAAAGKKAGAPGTTDADAKEAPAGPDGAHGEMAKRHGSAGSTDFSTDDVEHPEFEGLGEEEEEEEEKPAAKTQEPAPTTTKGSATIGAEKGKITGKGSVARATNPGGSGSDVALSAEGGADGERAYGTVGAGYTSRTRDPGEPGKQGGMDVKVGGKAGTNEKGEFVAQGNVGATVKREDGSETQVGSTVGYDGQGVTVGKNASHQTTLHNGDKKTTSGGATFNAGSGDLAANVGTTTTDAKGDVKTSTQASGKVDIIPGDGKQGASGSVSHTSGGVNVVAHGGWKQELKAPVEDGGRFRVDYTESFSAGGSLGGKGKKVGASAGVSFDKTQSGTRYFKNKPDAERFWKEGSPPDGPDTADAARKMQEGETHSTSTGKRAEASGNAQVGMFSVGAGANFGNENFENTKRGAGGSLRMEVGAHVFAGWNASAGAGGVSLGYGRSETDSKSRTVEFDLDTEVGRWAYDYYRKHEKLPPSGRGWREVGTMAGKSETRAKSLGLLGMAAGVSHTVSHTDRQEDGHTYEEDLGVEGTSASIPLIGSHEENHGLFMRQVDNERTLYQTESVVKSSSTDGIRKGINRGTDQAVGSSGSNKGTYKVQSVFSQQEIDGFIDRVAKGGRGGGLHSDLAGLRSALSRVKDDDSRRRVLARWVADNGGDALQAMFDLTKGDANTNFYVEIEGDAYLKGMAGHLDQENHIARWQTRLDKGEGGFAIANEVAVDLAYQRKRRDALRKYGELPQRMLELEYERTDQHLLNLQLLQDRALASVHEMAPNAPVGAETAQYQQACHLLRRSRKQYAEAHERVQRSRRIHLDGYGRGLGLADSAKEEFTSERDRYNRAEKLFRGGEAREQAATGWEALLSGMKLGPDSAGPMASHTARASFEFQAAARGFDQASEIYGEIAGRRGTGGLLEGYNYRYVDGM